MEQSKQDMYGRPGDRGGSIMDNTMAMGSMSGVGPKAVMSQGSKAMGDYAQRNSQIRNYIDSLKYSGLQKSRKDSFNMMNTMPRSNEIPYQGSLPRMDTPGQQGNLDLSGIDYQELVKNQGGGGNKKDPYSNVNTITPMNTFSGQDLKPGTSMGGYYAGNDPKYYIPAF